MTRLGPKSQSRRGRTSRRRLVGLNLGLLRPAISDDQSENYDNGEDCCQPRPHRPRAIRHLAIDTAQWIGAARTGVAGIRHDSPQFLRGLTFVGKETANRSQCSYARFCQNRPRVVADDIAARHRVNDRSRVVRTDSRLLTDLCARPAVKLGVAGDFDRTIPVRSCAGRGRPIQTAEARLRCSRIRNSRETSAVTHWGRPRRCRYCEPRRP